VQHALKRFTVRNCSETFTGLWENRFRRGIRESQLQEAVVSILVFRCQGEPRDDAEHPPPQELAVGMRVVECECHPPPFGCAPSCAEAGSAFVP
jgi:hypothetical protein